MENVRFLHPVPYYAQIASPNLADAVFRHGFNPMLDPRWREWGFPTLEEYAYWVDRACGIVCVKMAIEACGGQVRPLAEWIRKGQAIGGYLVVKGENGESEERGWVHKALASLICDEGFFAEPRRASITEIIQILQDGGIVMASVSYEIGEDGPVTKKSGHLVLVTGADFQEDRLQTLIIQNPSGRTAELQGNAAIPVERFESGYSGRIVQISLGV